MKNNKLYKIVIVFLLASSFSCQKEFLEKKPDKALLVPETLTDFQQLLDNTELVMNKSPFLSSVACEQIYIPDNILLSLSPHTLKIYRWDKFIYDFTDIYNGDWDVPYAQVFYANIVLEGLARLKHSEKESKVFNDVKGQALFARAASFFDLVQEYAQPYVVGEENVTPGIPIRLASDINTKSSRATLRQSYDQIISDLEKAVSLLPENTQYLTRPCKPAALALLSRVYLSMRQYVKAEEYASKALEYNSRLLDYNTITATTTYKMPKALANQNPEIIYYRVMTSTSVSTNNSIYIDTVFQKSYSDDDLRKKLWFRSGANGMVSFRGHYTGSFEPFTGIATDELLLTKAECLARHNKISEAMSLLNKLLVTRWKNNPNTGATLYKNQTAIDAKDAISKILSERSKELFWRNLRWTDLRRLNQEAGLEVTLHRVVSGESINVLPNDKRYVLPIPETVIAQTGMVQNSR